MSRSGRSAASPPSASRRRGQEDVVGVEDRRRSRPGASGRGVLRRCLPAVLLPDEDDRSRSGSSASLDLVGRAVVADDDLERRGRLLPRRLEGVADHVGGLIRGDDDRKRRPTSGSGRLRCRRSKRAGHRSRDSYSSSNRASGFAQPSEPTAHSRAARATLSRRSGSRSSSTTLAAKASSSAARR